VYPVDEEAAAAAEEEEEEEGCTLDRMASSVGSLSRVIMITIIVLIYLYCILNILYQYYTAITSKDIPGYYTTIDTY
jgi:hypothetical protein